MGLDFEELAARGSTVKTDRNSDNFFKSHDSFFFILGKLSNE
jgi:hypothetical protein